MADFSTKLKDIIDSRGLSQTWLAEQAETTEATVSRYMNGINKPNLDVVARIAKVLNVSVDYLLDLSLVPEPYKEPEPEIAILCYAYRRADDDHKNILWSVLDRYVTPDEKDTIRRAREEEALSKAV